MNHKILLIFIGLCLVFGTSFALYQRALQPASYEGLPTVPCIDPTEKVTTEFSFTLHISIYGSLFPLDSTIGHDAGNCLHDMFTNDASGTVYIRSNDTEPFTLGQFFDEWHKTFTSTQLFQYETDSRHTLRVEVNNQSVSTYRDTLLSPRSTIHIIYE